MEGRTDEQRKPERDVQGEMQVQRGWRGGKEIEREREGNRGRVKRRGVQGENGEGVKRQRDACGDESGLRGRRSASGRVGGGRRRVREKAAYA
eukprot:3099149-Pleurochrysis_carterae.AAC.1